MGYFNQQPAYHEDCKCEFCHTGGYHDDLTKYYANQNCLLCIEIEEDLNFSVEFKFTQFELQEAKGWERENGFKYPNVHNLLVDWMIATKNSEVPYVEVINAGEVRP